MPFSKTKARRLLSRIVEEDSVGISADITQWHNYRLESSLNRSTFWVDETLVLETTVSSAPAIGIGHLDRQSICGIHAAGKNKMGSGRKSNRGVAGS